MKKNKKITWVAAAAVLLSLSSLFFSHPVKAVAVNCEGELPILGNYKCIGKPNKDCVSYTIDGITIKCYGEYTPVENPDIQ